VGAPHKSAGASPEQIQTRNQPEASKGAGLVGAPPRSPPVIDLRQWTTETRQYVAMRCFLQHSFQNTGGTCRWHCCAASRAAHKEHL